MLDSTTKKRIDDCRDILVGKLPDPKAQIEQITIGLIYKFMDDMDKEAIELGGSAKFFSGNFEKYSWDALFDSKVTAIEMLGLYSEAIVSMDKNPNIPQLFRDIFKNAYLPYRDPETLKMFLKTISEFEYTHSEKLGDAFEYLLSVMGSQGDAGQFRTPRHIIDFLVAVVNPRKTDTILDPACGTAGFLISAFKYIMNGGNSANDENGENRANGENRINGENGGRDKACLVSTPPPSTPPPSTPPSTPPPSTTLSSAPSVTQPSAPPTTPDERKKLIQNFVGYDISPDMVRLSLVNLYLHGFSDPHISEYDTLSSEERWDENFDVILANPPFMSPKGGIRPHKRFTISSNRSEVLFVDYIAEHLNPKGRAGVIVPEGVIFQSGTAYKELRKMLVDNYLYAVVSLPAGIFNPYSGVKTSILLMDKQIAKTSSEILFVKITNDGYNLGAQRNAVKGGQLEEAITIIRSFTQSFQNETGADDHGAIDRCAVETRHALSLPPAVHGGAVDRDAIDRCAVETRHALSLPHPPPHPPTHPQSIAHAVPKSEIAKSGDYNLSGERYKTVNVLSTNYESIKLGQICRVINGRAYKQEELLDTGKYPVLRVGNFFSNRDWYFSDFELEPDKYCLKGDLLYAWSASFGPKIWDGDKCIYHYHIWKMEPDESRINKHFLYHVLNKETEAIKAEGGRGIAMMHITKSGIEQREIPLPPLSVQQEIVAEIEGYQKIIDGAKIVVENYKPKITIDPEWEMVELDEICEVKSGGTPDRGNDSYWNGTIPYIKTGQIYFNHIFEADEFISEEGLNNSSTRLIPKDTILMAMYGQGITRGRVAILKIEAAINQAVAAISLRDKRIEVPFLYFQLQCLYEYLREISDARGGNQSNLNSKLIKELKIALPPLETQRQIVAQIEKEQELVNANKQLIEIFEQKIKERIAKVWGA